MNFHVITLFPEAFSSYLGESIISRARENGKIQTLFYNPRDFVVPTKVQSKKDKPYKRIDDKPYGGGPGMIMQAEPVVKAIEKAILYASKKPKSRVKIVFFTPDGISFDNAYAEKAKRYSDIIMICGRYEGIDHRINKIFKTDKISIGNYTLTGGELPAMVLIDCISRRIKGVLGDTDSIEENRISSSEVYTRPEEIKHKGKTYRVPKVLLSGNHKKIEEWKLNR
jgi:tRNA (guanine37-N1)-methyltransferase